MNKAKTLTVRAAAAQVLKTVVIQQQSLDSALAAFHHFSAQDSALLKALCFGVLRHYQSLSFIANQQLSKALRNKDFDIFALILIGIYQLTAMRMPAYAALDSVVKASRECHKNWAASLINAVLRKVQQETITITDPQIQSEHPLWLYNRITSAWPAQANAIFDANNQHPPLCLRINQQKTTREHYLALLTQQGIEAQLGTLSNSAIYIQAKVEDVTQLPQFDQGFCSVQDEAAQMAAILLDVKDNMRVLDACAAPGGKTCHIMEQQANVDLLALDIDEQRLAKVQQNLQRIQQQATLKVADVCDVASWWDGQLFDRILCDAPCSATGVICRHADIKLLRKDSDIAQLAQQQLTILQKLWATLKPNGILLYATCSIMPDENEQVITQFCRQHSDCQLLAIELPSVVSVANGWQLLPQMNGHDGFYYARLQKRDM